MISYVVIATCMVTLALEFAKNLSEEKTTVMEESYREKDKMEKAAIKGLMKRFKGHDPKYAEWQNSYKNLPVLLLRIYTRH